MTPEEEQQALRALQSGTTCPYECMDNPTPATDWAHYAARGVLADLSDRRTIKRAFDDVDEEIREEITRSLAAIIRLAPQHFVPVPGEPTPILSNRSLKAVLQGCKMRGIAMYNDADEPFQLFPAEQGADLACALVFGQEPFLQALYQYGWSWPTVKNHPERKAQMAHLLLHVPWFPGAIGATPQTAKEALQAKFDTLSEDEFQRIPDFIRVSGRLAALLPQFFERLPTDPSQSIPLLATWLAWYDR